MKLLIGLLLLIGTQFFTINNLIAQTSDTTIIQNVDLDSVIISAQRTPVLRSELMRSVQVVSAREIQQSGAQDIASLLENIRGIDIRKRGTYGMQADISIRGGTFDQTLILLNGVNLTDPQTGHHNLNVPIDLESIERIEILHGPAARVFGPNAFSGAINIITKQPGEHEAVVSLTGGEHMFGGISAAGGITTGPVNHYLAISGLTSDGFTDNTDFKSENIFYRSNVSTEFGKVDLQAGYNQKAFGANSFYTPRFPDQFEETRSGFISLRWLPDGGLNITPNIYWRRHHDRFELFRNEAPAWYTTHNYHRSDILGAAINWVHVSNLGTTALGLDYRYEHIFSNVLGEEMPSPMPVPGYEEAFFTRSYDRNTYSLMLEQTVQLGNVTLSGGSLVFVNTELENDISLFPGIDIGWQMNEQLRFYTTVNRTLRLPTFTDLFYQGPDNLGNPDLKPEEAISVETGLKAQYNGIFADLAIYRRWGTNMIDWVRAPGDPVWKSENLTDVIITGVEAGVVLPLLYHQRASLSLQYGYNHADRSSGDLVSNYALDFLRNKIDIIYSTPVLVNGGINFSASWYDRNGTYIPFVNNAFTDEVSFDSQWVINAKAYWNFQDIRVFGEVSNLFSTEYAAISNVPQPGRWVRFGISTRFRY